MMHSELEFEYQHIKYMTKNIEYTTRAHESSLCEINTRYVDHSSYPDRSKRV